MLIKIIGRSKNKNEISGSPIVDREELKRLSTIREQFFQKGATSDQKVEIRSTLIKAFKIEGLNTFREAYDAISELFKISYYLICINESGLREGKRVTYSSEPALIQRITEDGRVCIKIEDQSIKRKVLCVSPMMIKPA